MLNATKFIATNARIYYAGSLFHKVFMTNAFSRDYVGTVGAAVQKLAAKRDNAMCRKQGTTRDFLGLSVKADERIFEQRAQRAKASA